MNIRNRNYLLLKRYLGLVNERKEFLVKKFYRQKSFSLSYYSDEDHELYDVMINDQKLNNYYKMADGVARILNNNEFM